jgi:hypothetical protein
MYRKAVILSRFIPWPSDTGAFLYSAMVAGLVTKFADDTVMVAAKNPFGNAPPPENLRVRSEPAPMWSSGGRKSLALRYLASGLPFAAQPFRIPALRRLASEELVGSDMVVLDHIGASWALDLALDAAKRGARLVYSAQNVESDTRRTMISAGGLRAVFARFDAHRLEVVECRLLNDADAVLCVSSNDRDRFIEMGARARLAVINPVRSGPASFVRLEASTPLRVVVVGSFHWSAKQQNLVSFLNARGVVPSAASIAVRVVGSMPESFQSKIAERFPDVETTGPVESIEDHLGGCRIGVIPEEEGGGFKLKALDYAYAGLPIFGLEIAMRGLPLQEGRSMRAFGTMEDLWTGIVAEIGNLPLLDQLRLDALATFESGANVQFLQATLAQVLKD